MHLLFPVDKNGKIFPSSFTGNVFYFSEKSMYFSIIINEILDKGVKTLSIVLGAYHCI